MPSSRLTYLSALSYVMKTKRCEGMLLLGVLQCLNSMPAQQFMLRNCSDLFLHTISSTCRSDSQGVRRPVAQASNSFSFGFVDLSFGLPQGFVDLSFGLSVHRLGFVELSLGLPWGFVEPIVRTLILSFQLPLSFFSIHVTLPIPSLIRLLRAL